MQTHYIAQKIDDHRHEENAMGFEIRADQAKAEEQRSLEHQWHRIEAVHLPATPPVDQNCRGGGPERNGNSELNPAATALISPSVRLSASDDTMPDM